MLNSYNFFFFKKSFTLIYDFSPIISWLQDRNKVAEGMVDRKVLEPWYLGSKKEKPGTETHWIRPYLM